MHDTLYDGTAQVIGSDYVNGVVRLNIHVTDAGPFHPFRTLETLHIDSERPAVSSMAQARLAAILAATGRFGMTDTTQLHGHNMRVRHNGSRIVSYTPAPHMPSSLPRDMRSAARVLWDRFADAAREATDIMRHARDVGVLLIAVGLANGFALAVLLAAIL